MPPRPSFTRRVALLIEVATGIALLMLLVMCSQHFRN